MGATHSTDHPVTLQTPQGPLHGIEQRDATTSQPILYRYSRIPYAQPPVGPLRFRKPKPLPTDFRFTNPPPTNSSDSTTFGPICPQPVYAFTAASIDNPRAAPEPENAQDEDCLYLNIWIPCETDTVKRPAKGWPVQFHIHGGWLQVGDPCQNNMEDPYDLLRDTAKRIIVAPGYRLNMFGFLAGPQLRDANGGDGNGNFGLWDQRMALEWVYANIGWFGGDRELINVGGLSAGSHSAFMQVYFDLFMRGEGRPRCIRQVYLWSNAVAVQPKDAGGRAVREQVEELLGVVGVGSVEDLRGVGSGALVEAIGKMKAHTFRTVTDGEFVPERFLSDVRGGALARRMREEGVRVVLGEVKDEGLLYKLVNPPSNSSELRTQIGNYYPENVVNKLLQLKDVYDIPGEDRKREDFEDVFAEIVSDMQVHAAVRGFTRSLLEPESGVVLRRDDLLRYRIEWRAKGLDAWLKPEVGVCHAADSPVWWGSGWRADYTEEDKERTKQFLEPFGRFLYGEGFGNSIEQGGADVIDLVFTEDGEIKTSVKDDLWEKKLKVWDAVGQL